MSDEAMSRYAIALADAVQSSIGPWVVGAVERRHPGPMPPTVAEAAEAAARAATADVDTRLRQLLALDIDDQWTNPLAIIRSAATFPTEVLREAGVAPVARDVHDARINPDDVYDLAPAAFADLGPVVHERGIEWGAAKAHLHLRRRRSEDLP